MDVFDTSKEIQAEFTRMMNDPDSTPFLPQTLPFKLECWNLNCDEELSNDKNNIMQGNFQPQNFNGRDTYRNEHHEPFGFTGTFALPHNPFPESSPRLMVNPLVQQEPRLEIPPIPNSSNDPFAKLQTPRVNILMVYGLNPEKSNPDYIFNLFCLYGNVIIVKFLLSKPGCAAVQMDSILSVKRCIDNLNNIPLFGDSIQLVPSKNLHVMVMSSEPSTLPDNSPSYKEYFNNRNHRFDQTNSKDTFINKPSKVIYFYNTPPSMAKQTLLDACEKKTVRKPLKILFLTRTHKSSSGLLEFETVEYAVEFLFSCNHYDISVPSKSSSFKLKLNFSRSHKLGESSKRETIKNDIIKEDTNKNTTNNGNIKEDNKEVVTNKYNSHENVIKEDTTKNDSFKEAIIKEVTTQEDTIVYYKAKTVTTKNDTIKDDTTKKSTTYEGTIKQDTTTAEITKKHVKNNANNVKKDDNSIVSILKKDNIKKASTNKKVTFNSNTDQRNYHQKMSRKKKSHRC